MSMPESSNSYRGAKVNFSLIQKFEYWDNTLIERLDKSLKDNSQIDDSFGLTESRAVMVKDAFMTLNKLH